jgi:hypothetical protein
MSLNFKNLTFLFIIFFAFQIKLVKAFSISEPEVEEMELAKKEIIGKIVSFATTTNAPKFLWGEKVAAEGRSILEGETISTIAGQTLSILMNDGSRLEVSPSTTVKFVKWKQNSNEEVFEREIFVKQGLVWFKIRKIYSQLNPLYITTKYGVVSVRGSEFVVDTDKSSPFIKSVYWLDKKLIENEKLTNRTEVYALVGDFFVSKSIKNLRRNKDVVKLSAGQFVSLSSEFEKPLGPSLFDKDKLASYVKRSLPDIEITIHKNTSQELRTKLVGNFFEIKPNNIKTEGVTDRAIASVPQMQISGIPPLSDEEKNALDQLKKYKLYKTLERRSKALNADD